MCKTRPVLNGAAFFAWCRAPLRLGGHGAAGNPHSLDAVARDVGHLEDEARLLEPVTLGGETAHPVEEKARERHVLAVDAHQAVDAAGLLDEEELDAALGAPAAFNRLDREPVALVGEVASDGLEDVVGGGEALALQLCQ